MTHSTAGTPPVEPEPPASSEPPAESVPPASSGPPAEREPPAEPEPVPPASSVPPAKPDAPDRSEPPAAAQHAAPVLHLAGLTLRLGHRTLWEDVDLAVQPGEFLAILGANGAGKSSLLRVVAGDLEPSAGSVEVCGQPATGGSRAVGYVPQRTAVDELTPITARDLVRLGLDGHRWGPGLFGSRRAQGRVIQALRAVDAAHLADVPVARLSGGELQRVRVAEALIGHPALLLCDEPLAALDMAQAQNVVSVLDRHRRSHETAILFVTHDINAVLSAADRVLYLAGGRYRLGTPDEVLTSASLTDLYGAPVDVFRTQGRVIVVAATDPGADRDELVVS